LVAEEGIRGRRKILLIILREIRSGVSYTY